jgi:RNA polymerase sigma-70 factor (ECF subfamily)
VLKNYSFNEMMAGLRHGDDQAATAVFQRFAHKLIQLARDHIQAELRHKVEPEDVVQSAYRSFFTRYGAGPFEVGSWNDLWGLLTLITLRKCVNRVEYYQAQCRDIRREVVPQRNVEDSRRPWEPIDRAPTPLEAAVLTETVTRLLGEADGCERPILELSLQGFTVADISAQLQRAERTVRRVRERFKRTLLRLQEDD